MWFPAFFHTPFLMGAGRFLFACFIQLYLTNTLLVLDGTCPNWYDQSDVRQYAD